MTTGREGEPGTPEPADHQGDANGRRIQATEEILRAANLIFDIYGLTQGDRVLAMANVTVRYARGVASR